MTKDKHAQVTAARAAKRILNSTPKPGMATGSKDATPSRRPWVDYCPECKGTDHLRTWHGRIKCGRCSASIVRSQVEEVSA